MINKETVRVYFTGLKLLKEFVIIFDAFSDISGVIWRFLEFEHNILRKGLH